MLLHRESVSNVMDLIVLEKPLFVGESNEAFNQFVSPYFDGSTGFVSTEHRFDCVNERNRYSALCETIPSKVVNTYC